MPFLDETVTAASEVTGFLSALQHISICDMMRQIGGTYGMP